jgi:hypothetical protein
VINQPVVFYGNWRGVSAALVGGGISGIALSRGNDVLGVALGAVAVLLILVASLPRFPANLLKVYGAAFVVIGWGWTVAAVALGVDLIAKQPPITIFPGLVVIGLGLMFPVMLAPPLQQFLVGNFDAPAGSGR